VLGGPEGGTVLAAAIARDNAQTAVAATEVGIYRAELRTSHENWSRLVDLPGTPTALALSPAFEQDSTLLIGTTVGPMVSTNGGKDFQTSSLPRSSTHVVNLELSPNFLQDGIAFAGTLEDGVLVSRDRGKSWAAWNFGLFELEVIALALSPNFARDETLLISTANGLYYSYNGGRAWRELEFPSNAQPVLSLTFSPTDSDCARLFAGTEASGLYRGIDPLASHRTRVPFHSVPNRTTSPHQIDVKETTPWLSLAYTLDAATINALAFNENGTLLFAATERGIFVTHADAQWQKVIDVPGALCLAVAGTFGIAGVGYQGEPETHELTVSVHTAEPFARPVHDGASS
jgi:hypothetical protein